MGRGHDLNRLTTFLQIIEKTPEAAQVIEWSNFIMAVASAANIDVTGIVKTPEQMQQEQQQAQMVQMGQAVAPEVAKGVMNSANGGGNA